MAESEFNLGPNYPPGGAPENPRVNNSAYDSEMKKTQQLQADTLKSLNETIKGLSEQYAELTANDRKLTDEELAASKMLREKIDVLSQILESVKSDASKGGPQVPLSAIGIKERTETFTKLSKVITDFQRSSADLRAAGGGEMEFDQWFSTYLEQQKLDNLSLSQQEHNNLLLQDVKKILKDSNTSLSSLSEDELEELAKRSIKLSIDQKQIETDLLAQNRDVIKLNKDANAQDIKNTKAIVESSKFDPSKPIIEYGFKTVNKQMAEIVENTKPRSLFKIVTDLMGPLGKIIYFFTKVVVGPLLFTFGIITGFLLVQYGKLKGLGALLSGEVFLLFLEGLKRFKNIIVFLYKDVPLIVSSFINQVSTNAAKAVQPMRTISRIFANIASGSETFFYAWTKIVGFVSKIPSDLSRLYGFLKSYESIGNLRVFGKAYVIAGDALIGIGKIIDKLKPTFETIGKFGTSITNLASYIGSIVGKIFSPVTQLFSSNLGKALIGFDKLGVGLSSMFKFGVSIGKWLGGVTPWFVTLITLFADIPKFFKALFYTDAYTAIKSVMALIVQVAGLVLSTLFGGPLGAIAASYVLKFENIMKWLDPIFDFIIYTGGIVLGLLYSIYKDFVQPAFEAIGQVALTVLNLGFALLKPIFKFAQFVLLLLTPLFAIVALAFKGVGYIFKGITILFKAINNNIVEPFIKFSEWFMFKFIQPIYDFLASTWFGRLAGMETREKRLARERKQKLKTQTAEGESKNSIFSEINIDTESIGKSVDIGIGKTKEFVNSAVDKTVGVVESTTDSLKFISKDFSGSIYHLSDTLKTQLTPITNTMIHLGKSLGMRATEFGNVALDKMNTPMVQTVLTNLTTPVSGYSTATTITPSNAPANNRMAEEYQWMASLLEKASGDEKNRAANNTVNNQQTTVVNNTSGGSSMTMPSNSERTVNQINNSVRPAG